MAKISFYFDEMMTRRLAKELIKLGYDVVMANDVGMTHKLDEEHLVAATERGMLLLTMDRGFAGRSTKQSDHAGVLCWTRGDQNLGAMVRTFSEFAQQHSADEVAGQVYWIK